MILTYIDENGTSYDLPKQNKTLRALMKDIDLNVSKGLEDNAYKGMLDLAKKCLGEDATKELFGSLKYDDDLDLTSLNVACVHIAAAYRKPIEEAQTENSNIEQATKLLEAMGNVKDIKGLMK